jgi:hypothetical protein
MIYEYEQNNIKKVSAASVYTVFTIVYILCELSIKALFTIN